MPADVKKPRNQGNKTECTDCCRITMIADKTTIVASIQMRKLSKALKP